jgi:hypothetical protein
VGQVTAFVVTMTAALLLMAGLVFDGGETLAAQRQAINEAEAAARAGAQAIDLPTYRAGGPLELNPGEARADALAYLAATGHQGEVSVTGTEVSVTVHITVPMRILDLAGLGARHVAGHGVAQAEYGVEGPEP